MRCHGQALARDGDGERYKLQASTPGYDRDRASDLAPSVSQSVDAAAHWLAAGGLLGVGCVVGFAFISAVLTPICRCPRHRRLFRLTFLCNVSHRNRTASTPSQL